MLVFVLNQAQKANTGKIQTPVYENVREFGLKNPVSDERDRARNGTTESGKTQIRTCGQDP